MTPERWEQVKRVLQEALEVPAERRRAFLDKACNGDQPLRQEVESLLLEAREGTEGFLRSPIDRALEELQQEDTACVGRRIGPYEIVEILGEGGMGTVYRAARADEQYQKQVAIKIAKLGLSAPSALARFRAERQILANLDHPNIARLVDGGTTESGLPYVVMELVEGQPITEYCDARGLSIEERLGLFRTVCLAVQYAHQHLVVHRDLKPGNILVTADGVPKLLDFGIAKILDAGSMPGGAEPTINLMRMLTPEYASPEQVRGDTVTTASDVYSLGVILFLLLTGRHPYAFASRSADEIVRALCDTEPPKPSTVAGRTGRSTSGGDAHPTDRGQEISRSGESFGKIRKRLRGDLDNVVLMALRKNPQRRYASAEQFAEDIRRHLQNLPVLARNDTVEYRVSKFIARHKTGSAATAVVAILLLAALFITVHEARVARRQAQIAREQSARADRRFNDVRALANSLIFDVHDSIQDLPGATPARQLIVEKALQYLDSLARESQGDPSLQRELAAAYKRIGDVQGYEFNANLGDPAAALASYQKALAIRKALSLPKPESVSDAVELSESFRLVSQMKMFSNDLSAAVDNSQSAIDIMEPMAKAHPADADALLELIVDYQSMANIVGSGTLANLGNNTAATVLRRKQLDVAQQLANLNPGDDRGQGNLAIALTSLGDQLWNGGERSAPVEHYARARAIFAKLASHSRKRARAVYLLNEVDERIAIMELSNGQLKQALRTARATTESAWKLSLTDPQDVQSGTALADDYVLLANLESRSAGGMPAAASDLDKAAALMTRFSGSSPKDTQSLSSQAERLMLAGDLAVRGGDYHRALKSYDSAMAVLARVQSESSRNVAARVRLAVVYNKVGRAQIKLRDFAAAAASFTHARALADVEGAAANANVEALYAVADSYSGLGEVEAALGADARQDESHRADHWQQAVSYYERSLTTWAQVKEPGMVSPDAFDAVPPAAVSQRLALAKTTRSRFIEGPPSAQTAQKR